MAQTHAFYIVGGTLPTNAPCYITRAADAQLLSHLLEGEFCYVLNTRQIGKSSLMVRTAQRLREQGTRVALLDLTAIGQNVTVEEWYDGLLTLLGEQLHLGSALEDFWLDHPNLGPMQRWIQALRQVILEEGLPLWTKSTRCVVSPSPPMSSSPVFGNATIAVYRTPFLND